MEPEALRVVEADVVVDSLSLHVERLYVEGASDTIVFLHDALGSIRLWRDFPKQLCLATRCNGLVYDREGYGGSDQMRRDRDVHYLEEAARPIPELLGVLSIQRAVLFGHSDGGSIALVAAAEAPHMVSAVITEAAHVFVEDITLAGIRQASTNKDELVCKLRSYHGDKADAVFSGWSDVWQSPAYLAFNLEKYLPKIMCPLLAIQGEMDEYGTERQVDAIVNGVSGPCQKLMMAGVGHTPHREQAALVIQAAKKFLSEYFTPS